MTRTNPVKPTPVGGYQYDCNNSWDWSPWFVFKNTFKDSFNQYAEIIFNGSNSYGFPFSDFLGKPLVALNDAAALKVTILEDDVVNGDYSTAVLVGPRFIRVT